jgi:hypothetical protein
MSAPLDLFAARLPHRPYCSDDLAAGLHVRGRELAQRSRYIQPNPPASVGWLVFDLDRAGAAFAWESANLPPPTIAATNPANAHAHLLYGLSTPVVRTDLGRQGPLRFLAAVQGAMTDALRADRAYAMHVCKNPLHPHWRTLAHDGAVYDLPALAEYVDLTRPAKPLPRAEIAGLGRNCALFDTLRAKAYRTVAEYRGGDPAAWDGYIMDAARKLNSFTTPLPDAEVKATARSVAKWVWRRFGQGPAVDRFADRQRHRAGLAARAKRGNTAEAVLLAVQALQRSGQGVSVVAVAELAGLHRNTVQRFYRTLLQTTPMLPLLDLPDLTHIDLHT